MTERQLYRALYRIVWAMGERFELAKSQYPTWRIAMVYFWALLHDRPICWALRQENWPGRGRHRLPSNATMSRRLRRTLTRQLVQAVAGHVLDLVGYDPSVLYLDGKALPVGGLSGDPDTSVGYGAGKKCRGFKLHLICDRHGVPVVWKVKTMVQPEWIAAGELVERGPRGPGYIVADGNYDKNALYDQVAARGRQLVATRHQGQGTGHRRQSPHRLRSLALGESVRTRLLRQRGTIERLFGNLCSGAGGLAPLPSWVRRRHRVELWVEGKIILHCLRRLHRQSKLASPDAA
jgi:hypothetical protein